MGRDIHKFRFDEGTLTKLSILRQYIRSWFPVFFSVDNINRQKIEIYDFFAGEGTDIDGIQGSPLIFLEELRAHCSTIKERNLKVELLFNEIIRRKYSKLTKAIEGSILNCRKSGTCPSKDQITCPFSVRIIQRDFKELFHELYPMMLETSQSPRFMFLDQNGIKSIDHDIFLKLISLERTDFLFFIASTFANRFAELPEFQEYLKLTRQDFEISKPYHCHRVILNYYKILIPSEKKYYLAPFSIKKPVTGNIYGLIFGSNHLRGLEKFLDAAWDLDENTGEANYNIDDDCIQNPTQYSLFPDLIVTKKTAAFEELLLNLIKEGAKTNKQVYQFTLESGFRPFHANKILRDFQDKKKIKTDFVENHDKVRKHSFFLQYNPKKLIRISYEADKNRVD
jgi:three-Cys-motif partner protein